MTFSLMFPFMRCGHKTNGRKQEDGLVQIPNESKNNGNKWPQRLRCFLYIYQMQNE